MKGLNYWKNNAEEDYIGTPISVLKYITELENNNKTKQFVIPVVMPQLLCLVDFNEWTITKGEKYTPIFETDEEYCLVGDTGMKEFYFKHHFAVLEAQ